jgi:Glycosyl hydrolases family 28
MKGVGTKARRVILGVLASMLGCSSRGIGTGSVDAQDYATETTRGDVVIPYEGTREAIASQVFTVTVNGSPVFVESFAGIAYARFAFSGTAHVEVGLEGVANPSAYGVSPRSFGIAPAQSGGSMEFNLTRPRKLLVWDGAGDDKLLLFADSLEDAPVAPTDPGVVDIAGYVVADGVTVLTSALQRALDSVAANGGGTLYFGPGTYLTGSLRIGSHTTVYLAPGATLRGTGQPDDYPGDPDLSNGVAGHPSAITQVSQIEFDDAVESRLIGRGTVDMNGSLLRAAGLKGGRLLMVKNSRDIEVEGVVLRDPASWNTQIIYSSDVSVTNVKVLNHAGMPWNLDGIDPDSSQNVTVDDTFVYSGDDSFAVKSTGSYRGLVRDPRSIVIRNSTVSTLTAALKIGSESLASYAEAVTFENDDVIQAACAIRALVRDGSVLRNNRWRAIRVEQIRPRPGQTAAQLMQFVVERRHKDSVVGSIESAAIDGLLVRDVSMNPSTFLGFDAVHGVSDVRLSGLEIAGKPIDDVTEFDAAVNSFAQPPTVEARRDGEPTISIDAAVQYASPTSPGAFRVSRSAAGPTDLEVDFDVRGSAANGFDYATVVSHVILPKGATSAVIPIEPTAPDGARPVKTVRLSLVHSPTRQYMLGPSYQAVVTLLPTAP